MQRHENRRLNPLIEVFNSFMLKLIRSADYDPTRIYFKTRKAQHRRFSF